jgi:hypothetical protein
VRHPTRWAFKGKKAPAIRRTVMFFEQVVKNNFQVDRDEREVSRIAASSARKTLL